MSEDISRFWEAYREEKEAEAHPGFNENWLCPVSRAIMKDPVVAADGQTYERNAIESGSVNRTSPLTRKQISPYLVPNQILKGEILEAADRGRRMFRENMAHGSTTGVLAYGDFVHQSRKPTRQSGGGKEDQLDCSRSD
jgi:hypothetical protein